MALPSVRPAVAFLGPVQLDLAIPQQWVSDIETWDITPLDVPAGGHRVCVVGYDASGYSIVSWGLRKLLTPRALATYALGLWTCVSRSWLDATGKTPAGLDWDTLAAEGLKLAA